MGLWNGFSRADKRGKQLQPHENLYKLPLSSVSCLLYGHVGRAKKWETPTKVFYHSIV